jgi:hypothetical protein
MGKPLDFFSPERSMIRFIIGTAALTVAIQIVYDLVKERSGLIGGIGLALLLILAMLSMLWLDARLITRRALKPEEHPITPHKGLILMISPHNTFVPLESIRHHQQALEQCWLIASQGEGEDSKASQDTAEELAKIIHEKWPGVQVHFGSDYQVDPDNIESTWQMVTKIFDRLAGERSLGEKDVVADITGGLKPMTAGMALACSHPERAMQYMKSERGEHGDPLRNTPLMAVQISTRAIYGEHDL